MEAFEKPEKSLFEDGALDRDANAKPLKEGTAADFAVENPLDDNGVRVSMNGKEGTCGDEDDGGEGLEDSEMNGVSSLLQMKKSVRKIGVNGGGDERVKGFGSLLGAVHRSKEIGDDNVLPCFDIHGETVKIDGDIRRDLDDKDNGGGSGGGRRMRRLNEVADGKGDHDDDDDDDDDDDEDGDWDCEFSAGDFVWGKIRSHPWWPGQVYDPSDASDYAVKVRQKGRLLVAYFGDSSFAWCHPSQLKPFVGNFEEMSKLSSSKNFLNAVQTSVDEIGRLLELKMTCSCAPKENCSEIERPLAANAGIKKGVHVPEGGIEKLSIGLFEPKEVLHKLKHLAQDISMSNLLERTVLKGWFSAFTRSMGSHQIPMYQEPSSILDLEENDSTLVVDMSDYNEAVEVPAGLDEPSSSGIKFSQLGHTLLRCPEISEDGTYRKRKEKSIAEIIKGEDDAQIRKDEDVALKGTDSGEHTQSSRRKKTKANNDDGIKSTSTTRKRKGAEVSGSLEAGMGKMSTAETDVIGAKEEIDKGYTSRGRKKKIKGASDADDDTSAGRDEINEPPVSGKRKLNVGSGVGNSDAETKDLIESGSPRERKKSKYLSPPYTSPTGKLSKTYLEVESLKFSNDSQLGEQMAKAADNGVSSPLVGERNQLPAEVNTDHKASTESSLYTPEQQLNRMIDLATLETPAPEVLTEVRSAALSPQYPRKKRSFDTVAKFLLVFRSSVYREGSNYEVYNQFQSHRKRNSPDSLMGSSGKDQILTDYVPSEHNSKKKKAAKNEETKMDEAKTRQAIRASPKKTSEETKAYSPKIKQAGRVAAETKDNEVESVSAALFVTFGPGSSLPTKDDLIRIYSRYGALKMEDTDMFYNNFCARVVFLRISDAQEAFNSSQKSSPFGASNVSFRLRIQPAVSAHEQRQTPKAKPSPVPKKGVRMSKKSTASQNSADQASQLKYIRDKLEMLTSMLETSDEKMSSEIKSKVQDEIKGLLEKVNTMVGSSS